MRARLPLLAILLALSACPRPLSFGPTGEITDPKDLMRLLDERADRVQTVKAEAKAHIRTPQQSGNVGEFVAVKRPDSLHLETLDFFGKPVAALAADGQRFSLYNSEDGSFYTGPASAANVSRLLPLVLDPREAVMILSGELPRLAAEGSRLEVDKDKRAYVLTLQSGGTTQRLWVGTEDLRPLRSEIRGMAAYDLTFDDFQLLDGIVFPFEIELVSVDANGRRAGVEITLKYREVELNAALEPALFTLEPPPNAHVIEVDPFGRPLGGEEGATPPGGPTLPPGAQPGNE